MIETVKEFVTKYPFEAITVTMFALVVIVILVGDILDGRESHDFMRVDLFVQECVESERYTREECIDMAAGVGE